MRKKIYVIGMIFILITSLVGCSSDSEKSSKKELPTLTYIGHATVKLKSKEGKVIYIDPYEEGDYSEAADYILVTHEHEDHNVISKCTEKDDTVIIRSEDALVDGEYKTFDYDNIKIEAVPSGGNKNHSVTNCVGYIVTIDGVTVFHAGDTSMNDKTNDICGRSIDYALYPVDGTYNMDAEEATEMADLIGAKHNIPIHEYNMGDEKKSDNFKAKGKLVLKYGETISIGD